MDRDVTDIDNAPDYRIILQNLFEPFSLLEIIRDEKGKAVNVRFIDVNPAYEKVMKVSRIDVIGKTFDQIWPNPEEVWIDNIIDASENGIHAHFEGYSREVDRYLHSMAFPVLPDRVGVLFLDITDWQQSNEALDFSNAKLLQYREELRELVTKLSLAEEKVRRSISTEIHDNLGYYLVDTLNELKSIEMGLINEKDRERMKVATEKMRHIVDMTRRLTFQISSPILYEVGLGAALKKLGEDIFEHKKIGFSYKGKLSDQGISDDLTVLLFQIARELMINIVKHAEATQATVTLRRSNDKVTIVVEDNGIGFSPEKVKSRIEGHQFGLFSIRERLSYLGGKIQIYSEEGRGSTISVTAPFSPAEKTE